MQRLLCFIVTLLFAFSLFAQSGAAVEPPADGEAAAAETAAGTDDSSSDATDPADAAPDPAGGEPPEETTADDQAAVESAAQDIFLQSLPLDIATADYYALLSWVRSLNLPQGGTAAELRVTLYKHYGVEAPAAAAAAERTIVIESADSTEFISATEVDTSLIRLSGGVVIKLTDNTTNESHTITAAEVLYNKDASRMIARGSVMYERAGADGTDIFMGDMLTIDLDDWSGIFVDGRNTKGGSTSTQFVFEADEILKKTESVLLFKDGRITSSQSEHPYFSIRASRIWILGGKEWAIANATLYVGELPVLYLPVFYYPGQEIVFHPVFGYREREGRFVQTTTYLLGEKPDKKETISLFNLTEGSNRYVRKVEGLFLQNTEERKSGSSADFIKILADVYTQLGGSAMLQAQLAKAAFVQNLKARLGLGFSRSVYETSDGQTPFVADNGYASAWNKVNVLGQELPFRFLFDLSFALKLGPFALNTALGFLSDPFYSMDYGQRSEDMDWLSFLRQPEDENPPGRQASFVQKLDISASYTFAKLNPWLGPVSLSRLSSSLNWIARALPAPVGADAAETETLKRLQAASPAREFFIPESFVLMDAALGFSGKLFEYPFTAASASGSAAAAAVTQPASAEPAIDPLNDFPLVLSPWQNLSDGSAAQSSASSTALAAEPDFQPEPPLKQPARTQRKPFTTALSWQFNPSFKWDGRFATEDWKIPEDVDWSLQYGLQSAKLSGSTAFTIALYDALFKADASLNASASYQRRPTQDSEVSETIIAAWKTQDAQARYDLVSGTFRLASSPLQDFWLLAPSSLSWSLGAALYNYKFDQLQDDGTALYTTELVEWTKERIKDHNLRASLVLRPLNLSQTVAVTATLPPLLESYSWSVSSQLPFVNLSGQTRIFRPAEAEAFTWAPLSATLVLGASPWPVLTTNYTHDLEENRVTALAHRLSWNNLSANLQFAYTSAYTLSTSGWTALEEKFQPSLLSFAWNQNFSPDAFWHNRIKIGLGVSLNARQNLLRFVESTMSLSLNFKIQVHEFIDINFASVSQNSALWRYYSDLFDLSDDFAGLEQVNPVTDILNGFRFFDEDDSRRRSSLFKLKSLSVKVVHYMSDWNLSFELKSAPYLNQETKDYEFRNSWSVFLAWKAVPEIKTEVKKADDVYTW